MQMQSSKLKAYVSVTVRFSSLGELTPLNIEWEDGRTYEIDEVMNVCRAASIRAGGAGIRYTVRIGRTITYLFLEEYKWFVERRNLVD